MEQLKELAQINWWQVFLAIILLLVCIKFLWLLADWFFVEKLGLKTRKMRQKERESELLKTTAELAKTTAENLDKLQKRHTKDEEEFRNNLNDYMEESRKDRKALHDEMKQFTTNRVNDRQVSIDREKRLNDRIDNMTVSDKHRDDIIDGINDNIHKLTEMFVDKEIDDYRWEIINFATKVSEGKPCNKDSFKHCLRTYEKYEALLEKYDLENGEVEISMDIVNEAYKEKLKNGDF